MPPDLVHAPWWRDPLQPEPSPYEVFGVERTASLAEINAAASATLGKLPQRSWKAARTALIQPLDRAVVDLFLYNEAHLAGAEVSPQRDRACLSPAARGATQDQWLRELQERYPSAMPCHRLAIFWYWWAVYSDLRARERVLNGSLPYADEGERNARIKAAHLTLWRRAIGAWHSLVEDDLAIRSALPTVTDTIRGQALISARHRVVRSLEDNAEAWRAIGTGRAGAIVSMYEDLQGQAAAEAQSAEEVRAAGARLRGRTLVGGRILLQELGLTAAAQEALGPRAALALSAYQRLAALVVAGEPAAALSAIAELSQAERDRGEVRRIAADAHHALAVQAASLGDHPRAIHEWHLGLAVADTAQRAVLTDGLVSTCRNRASELSRRRSWDEVIDLLDRALAVVPNEPGLTSLLADALTSRGVQRVVQQQQREERPEGTREQWQALAAVGVADVERAAQLGGRRAGDELVVIRGWMRHLEELGAPGAELIAAAFAAARLEDWSTAVDTLQQVIDRYGPEMSQTARQRVLANLSVALGNRVYERLSRVDLSGQRESNRRPLQAASWDAQRACAADPTNVTARELLQTVEVATRRFVPGGTLAPEAMPRGSSGTFVVLAMIAAVVVCCGLSSGNDAPKPATGSAPSAAAPSYPGPSGNAASSIEAPEPAAAGGDDSPSSLRSGGGEVVRYSRYDSVAVSLAADLRRLESVIEGGDRGLAAREVPLNSTADGLDRESAKIDVLRKKAVTDKQVESLNRRVRAYNASVTAFQTEQAAYNAKLAEVQANQAEYASKWAQLKARAER